MSNKAVLKKGKEKPFLQRHHWIFSGAIDSLQLDKPGSLAPVYSSGGTLLGTAYFNPSSSIIGRIVVFGGGCPLEAIKNQIDSAISLREQLFQEKITNAYRLIHGEGDGIPGLIVDKYADVLILQVSTLGIEYLKSEIVSHLLLRFPSCRMIYEKSHLPTRKEEGLPEYEGLLKGELLDEVLIKENGISYYVSFPESQKTGFFLDQRNMRTLIREYAQGKRVLNCFSYTGGFSLSALTGGAITVDSVDISSPALDLAKRNFALNGFPPEKFGFYASNVFHFLRDHPLDYEMIILDPPAFAKRKIDIVQACRGYKDINRLAMQKVPSGSFLLTCSCSYHVDATLFQKVIFQAALESQRKIRILSRHLQAEDHPINIFHPEGEYLKSLFLFVE